MKITDALAQQIHYIIKTKGITAAIQALADACRMEADLWHSMDKLDVADEWENRAQAVEGLAN